MNKNIAKGVDPLKEIPPQTFNFFRYLSVFDIELG